VPLRGPSPLLLARCPTELLRGSSSTITESSGSSALRIRIADTACRVCDEFLLNRDKTEPHRVFAADEKDRDRRCGRLCSQCDGSISSREHHRDLPANQVGRQFGARDRYCFLPSGRRSYVVAFHIAGFSKALTNPRRGQWRLGRRRALCQSPRALPRVPADHSGHQKASARRDLFHRGRGGNDLSLSGLRECWARSETDAHCQLDHDGSRNRGHGLRCRRGAHHSGTILSEDRGQRKQYVRPTL